MKLTLLCIVLVTTTLHSQESPRPEQPKSPPAQWEYTVLSKLLYEDEKAQLEKLGAEGWELVSVVSATTILPLSHTPPGVNTRPRETASVESEHLRYYFKRLKSK